jgi:hypothetical protein
LENSDDEIVEEENVPSNANPSNRENNMMRSALYAINS